MPERNIRARVLVSGLVQGVLYRATAERTARSLGVRGWTRNLADGRVECLLEGTAGAVRRMIEWCREGPPAARVESVEVEYEAYVGDQGTFHTRG